MNSCDGEKIIKKGNLLLTSGFRKYPSERDVVLRNARVWMKGKKEDDGVFPYWRIHNKLYDLSEFAKNHPGGKFWIESTKGTDITEVFECSHIATTPQTLLQKFYVKDISTPRISPFTFEEDGFYKTLKRKAAPILKKVGTGPTREMLLIQDSLFVGFVAFGIMAAKYDSNWMAIISGMFMALMTLAAHNFFHQKDNWRMYLFDLSLASSEEWRISHALSHHPFPNTIFDYELTKFEPHLKFLPTPDKTFNERFFFLCHLLIIFLFGFFLETLRKVPLMLKGEVQFQMRNLLPLVEVMVLCFVSSSLYQGLRLWVIIQLTGSCLFGFIGVMAAHHHPEIYHDGDCAPENKDWGVHQVISTRERGEIFVNSLPLAAVSFGNHTLHHLFPTVDHSKLPYVQEAFLETCKEFGIKFEIYTPLKHAFGVFRQLNSITPNKNPPSVLKS